MATTVAMGSKAAAGPMTAGEKKVIFASSLGTVFEWYDFYIYGTLAPIIAKQFFSGLDPTAAFIFTLMVFAAGFLVRPFGVYVDVCIYTGKSNRKNRVMNIIVFEWTVQFKFLNVHF